MARTKDPGPSPGSTALAVQRGGFLTQPRATASSSIKWECQDLLQKMAVNVEDSRREAFLGAQDIEGVWRRAISSPVTGAKSTSSAHRYLFFRVQRALKVGDEPNSICV